MTNKSDIHINAPNGGGGPGAFRSATPLGINLDMDKWFSPGHLCVEPSLINYRYQEVDYYSYNFFSVAIGSTPNNNLDQDLKQPQSIPAITGSVALHGVNKVQDVQTVQPLLNKHKPSAASDHNFSFPLAYQPNPPWNTGYRYFGAPRPQGRKHAGCDLLGPPGTPIYAIADGMLVRGPYNFTGPRNNLPLTDAVEIRHGGLLIRYSEIKPGSYVGGKNPKKGQLIAQIGDCKMLHFEIYSDGASTASLTGGGVYRRRSDVTDPAPYLDIWVKNLPGKK